MKAKNLCIYRFSLIAILLIGFCAGCTGLDQKIQNSSMTQKMKNWQTSLQKKFNTDDKDSESADKEKLDEDKNASNAASSGIFVHTVQRRGETFTTISKWYTGNSGNAKALVSANPGINPNRIRIGSQVKIPEGVLKTRDPMSPAFADKHLPGYYEHKIRWPGETLSVVSKWYTGRYNNWKKLINHNPEINPKRIKIGQKIYIPDTLLKTRKPLPEKFAAKCLPSYFAHTVQRPGERLAEIAGWYTGDSKNWQNIARANPEVDPEFLLVGNEIYIPTKLLKTRKPIPPASGDISGQSPGNEASPPNPAAPQKKEKEIQLFGPKKFPKG